MIRCHQLSLRCMGRSQMWTFDKKRNVILALMRLHTAPGLQGGKSKAEYWWREPGPRQAAPRNSPSPKPEETEHVPNRRWHHESFSGHPVPTVYWEPNDLHARAHFVFMANLWKCIIIPSLQTEKPGAKETENIAWCHTGRRRQSCVSQASPDDWGQVCSLTAILYALGSEC